MLEKQEDVNIPSEEEQNEEFLSYLGKNVFRYMKSGEYISQKDLRYYAHLFLQSKAWGENRDYESLVSAYNSRRAKRAAETRKLRAHKEAEKALKEAEAARQGDLFN